MGKPESTPPVGQSVDQLMSSIRQAIEADDARARPADNPPPKPLNAPMAPRVANSNVSVTVTTTKPVLSEGDAERGPGYISTNPYRYRHALGSSPTYMSLRNRLASLNSRTKANSGRSFASLLGGDVRQEEARARGEVIEQDDVQPDFTDTEDHMGLRSSVVDDDTYSDDFAASELPSSSASYSSDYHEWSIERSLNEYAHSEPWVHPEPEPGSVMPPEAVVEPEPIAQVEDSHSEAEQLTEDDNTAADESDNQLPLEIMIRQVIEPELAHWFDEHLPDHVAAAMPDEDAFIHMIRPLIEDWLSDNLEPIVEKAVRDEIARITGLKR